MKKKSNIMGSGDRRSHRTGTPPPIQRPKYSISSQSRSGTQKFAEGLSRTITYHHSFIIIYHIFLVNYASHRYGSFWHFLCTSNDEEFGCVEFGRSFGTPCTRLFYP
ncbi:hypothetical protein TNCV_3551991 [Trichonephila clavipes]|nr:hypothetical protein TNCV_3551991 [Trichonephila clavipes]